RRHTRFSRDWSSDVCSSDLCPRYQTGQGQPAQRGPADGAVTYVLETGHQRGQTDGAQDKAQPVQRGALGGIVLTYIAQYQSDTQDRKSVVQGKRANPQGGAT